MKKIITVILSFLLFSTNVYADIIKKDDFEISRLTDSICNAIIYYDLYDSSSEYTIGSNVKIYDVQGDDQISERVNCYFYPIYKNNEVILTVYIYGNSAKISTIGVDVLNKIDKSDNFAIVSVESAAFILSDSQAELIETDSTEDVHLNDAVINYSNNIISHEQHYENSITIPNRYFQKNMLNVQSIISDYPLVAQNPYPNGCWAACIASVCNYYKGLSYTAKNVVQTCLGNIVATEVPSQGIPEIEEHLNKYRIVTVEEDHSTILDNYKTNLNNKKVYIIAWAKPNVPNGHVNVLYGYSERNNNTSDFYFMDPQAYSTVSSGATKYIITQIGSSFPTNNKIFGSGEIYHFVNSLCYSYRY